MNTYVFQNCTSMQRLMNSCFVGLLRLLWCVVMAMSLSLHTQAHAQAKTQAKKAAPAEDVLKYINPFIGTAGRGHTFPGAAVPFGMVQLSPDNGTEGADWISGYNYADSVIVGFSHTHLSGADMSKMQTGDLLDISLMPTTRTVNLAKPLQTRKDADWAARFSHRDEQASPGYYRVKFADQGLTAELTTTVWAGIHRYTFPASNASTIVLDLSFALNGDKTTSAALQARSNTLLVGHRHSSGFARKQTVFFALEFSKSFLSSVGFDTATAVVSNPTKLSGTNTRAAFTFKTAKNEAIVVKVALSTVSEEGALAGLKTVQDKSFELVKAEAEVQWRREMSRIRITTSSVADKTMFYTAFYHALLAPTLLADANAAYSVHRYDAATNTVQTSITSATDFFGNRYLRYDTFPLREASQAVYPLFTLTQIGRMNDMIQSMLAHWQENGTLPVWSLWGNEASGKTSFGYPAVSVLSESYLKGYFDALNRDKQADSAIKAIQMSTLDTNSAAFRHYTKFGYVPFDLDTLSVSKTLAYCSDDFAAAYFFREARKTDEYNFYNARSLGWRRLFDQETGLLRPRAANGNFKTPFTPLAGSAPDYEQGSGWLNSWYFTHTVNEAMALQNGTAKFLKKLDSLFTLPLVGQTGGQIGGQIGQYVHANTISHSIPYIYVAVGEPATAHERLHQIVRSFYKPAPDGLCGPDAFGQMSAWLVFTMMGFYPLNPPTNSYIIGTPFVDKVVVRLARNDFTVIVNNRSEKNIYIKSATLNGRPLASPYLVQRDFLDGGELVLEMTDKPTTLWKMPR